MIYDKISLMLPTYRRSTTYLPRFIESAMMTAKNLNNVCFAFCVNKGDFDTIDYINSLYWTKCGACVVCLEETTKPNLAKYFNILYDQTVEYGDNCVVTMMGDDMEFRTPGWDVKILEAINAYDGVGVFWANDDYIAKERCPVNMFVTRKMVEATEKPFMCEDYEADMIDYIWGKVGKYTKTSHYLPDVHIWHNHSTNKPQVDWDESFKRLAVVQAEAHKIGKEKAKEIARGIADTLIKKGFVGNSIC
jgi:hypothetical protein